MIDRMGDVRFFLKQTITVTMQQLSDNPVMFVCKCIDRQIAINTISYDRESMMGTMYSDLMHPACM